MLIPPQALAAAAVLSSVEALRPKGKTPLSKAVIEAARALRHSLGGTTHFGSHLAERRTTLAAALRRPSPTELEWSDVGGS